MHGKHRTCRIAPLPSRPHVFKYAGAAQIRVQFSLDKRYPNKEKLSLNGSLSVPPHSETTNVLKNISGSSLDKWNHCNGSTHSEMQLPFPLPIHIKELNRSNAPKCRKSTLKNCFPIDFHLLPSSHCDAMGHKISLLRKKNKTAPNKAEKMLHSAHSLRGR